MAEAGKEADDVSHSLNETCSNFLSIAIDVKAAMIELPSRATAPLAIDPPIDTEKLDHI